MIKSEKGQATVELAITITILFLILFGIIDFGRIFHVYLTMEHAGREAARVMSVGATDVEIRGRFREAAPSLDDSKISITLSHTSEQRTRGEYVAVEASYPISFFFPLFKATMPDPLSVKSKTVMRVE